MNLIIASHNAHKVKEIQNTLTAFKLDVTCTSLKDINFNQNIIEDALSFDGNALKKAKTVGAEHDQWILADDSGLCVPSLNGAPGIYSARYAGDKATDSQNNAKLLENLGDLDSQAYFHCSMVLYRHNQKAWATSGQLHGKITSTGRGSHGFGYDPIFYLEDKKCTLAEMPEEEKNKISHRSIALKKMCEILKKL